MTFQEIFNKAGLYQGNDFIKGYCFEVDDQGGLHALHYRDKDDILPIKELPFISKTIFNQSFVQILNRNQLYK